MKKISLCIAVMVLLVAALPVFAYRDNGEIIDGLRFDDVEVFPVYGSGKVRGVIENHTNKHIRFSGSILFCEIGDKVVADAYVSLLDVPASGSAVFDTYLRNGSVEAAKDSFLVKWVVDHL